MKTPGTNSPYRNRHINENLTLFNKMIHGEFNDGDCVLRAKIDMNSNNLSLRDPVLYRIIKNKMHYNYDPCNKPSASASPSPSASASTSNTDIDNVALERWYVYPMYDFAHAMSDGIEGITHSLCTSEFINNRPLYDWVIDNTYSSDYTTSNKRKHTNNDNDNNNENSLVKGYYPNEAIGYRPKQIEFSRLNIDYTILSKRKLIKLVHHNKKYVNNWNDPRMPTISGMRRRGYTSNSIYNFISSLGISKKNININYKILEEHVRSDLNLRCKRIFAVIYPLKVTICNFPTVIINNIDDTYNNTTDPSRENHEEYTEYYTVPYHPQKVDEYGKRDLPLTKCIYIDRSDFFDCGSGSGSGNSSKVTKPKDFHGLSLNGTVKLKYGPVLKCVAIKRKSSGGYDNSDIDEIICEYQHAKGSFPTTTTATATANANANASSSTEKFSKPKGIIQWVDSKHGVHVDIALYDRLFKTPNPGYSHQSSVDNDELGSFADNTLKESIVNENENEDENENDDDEDRFLADINPNSLHMCRNAVVEPSIINLLKSSNKSSNNQSQTANSFQFERLGYFCLDKDDTDTDTDTDTDMSSGDKRMIFNRIVTLKETWNSNCSSSSPTSLSTSLPTLTSAQTSAPKSAPTLTNKFINNIPLNKFHANYNEHQQCINQLDLRVGCITDVKLHPDADSLYIETIDVGDGDDDGDGTVTRTVISGLNGHIPMGELLGQHVIVICNLKPSKMRGVVSEGMLLAASDSTKVELVIPPVGSKIGDKVYIAGYTDSNSNVVLPNTNPKLGKITKSGYKAVSNAWDKIGSKLITNDSLIATFLPDTDTLSVSDLESIVDFNSENKKGNEFVLYTSAGVCSVNTLKNATIR